MIKINGIPQENYGVMFEQGFLEQLLKFPTMKAAITNASRHIDGVQIDAKLSKVDVGSVQLPFFLKGTDENDYLSKRANFQNTLINGIGNIGITELTYKHFKFRLRYESCEDLRIFAVNQARYMLTFTEPNPKNRSL